MLSPSPYRVEPSVNILGGKQENKFVFAVVSRYVYIWQCTPLQLWKAIFVPSSDQVGPISEPSEIVLALMNVEAKVVVLGVCSTPIGNCWCNLGDVRETFC